MMIVIKSNIRRLCLKLGEIETNVLTELVFRFTTFLRRFEMWREFLLLETVGFSKIG